MRWAHFQAAGLVSMLAGLAAAGCGQEGVLTLSLVAPSDSVFDPLLDGVTDYSFRTADGSVVAVSAKDASSTGLLPLGQLAASAKGVDVTVSLLQGVQLVGMGRVRDVVIEPGKTRQYDVHVRKPLIYVGSALPAERPVGEEDPLVGPNFLGPGKIFDPTSLTNLAQMRPLPEGISASAATSDGRYLIAGRANLLSVIDTGTGVTLGSYALDFTPSRIAIARRDAALAVADPDGRRLLIFTDLATFLATPANATPVPVALPLDVAPRQLAFSVDASRLYLLSGGTGLDPCDARSTPSPNQLLSISIANGSVSGRWNFSSFVAAFTVDAESDAVLVSGAGVLSLDANAPFGVAKTTKLFDATCPTALASGGGNVYVVTSQRTSLTSDNLPGFVLLRGDLSTNKTTPISLTAPLFKPIVSDSASNEVSITYEAQATSLSSYEIAISADGGRIIFATRVAYRIADFSFRLIIDEADCFANLDAVEYGLYTVDAKAGTSYESRSQLVLKDTPCLECFRPFEQPFTGICPSVPGDRAAGLSALFAEPH